MVCIDLPQLQLPPAAKPMLAAAIEFPLLSPSRLFRGLYPKPLFVFIDRIQVWQKYVFGPLRPTLQLGWTSLQAQQLLFAFISRSATEGQAEVGSPSSGTRRTLHFSQ